MIMRFLFWIARTFGREPEPHGRIKVDNARRYEWRDK
jgi:hypothetical protein